MKFLPALSQISMPDVTSIGKNVFYDCTSLTEMNLSGVQTIGSNAFNGCENLTKIHLGNVQSIGAGAFNFGAKVVDVTIDSVTAPKVDGGIFGKATDSSTLTIPAKALPSYLSEVVLGEMYTSTSYFEWNNLPVKAPDYATVTYTSPQDKYYNRAQLLAKGQSIGEKPFDETKNGYKLDGIYSDNSFNTAVDASYVPSGDIALYYKWGTITVSVADKDGNIVDTFELSTKTYNQLKDQYPALPEGAFQWNTERDGSGKTILANTKIFDDITLYPIFEEIVNVTVRVNDGAEAGAENLASAIKKAGEGTKAAEPVTKLEVVSGKLTRDDYLWMDDGIMRELETLIVCEGVESEDKTVPSPTSVSSPNLHHLEIHGVEIIEEAAIAAKNLHTLILPDVKKTGNSPWGATTNSTVFIKTVDLSSIEELGERAFSGQNQLPELNMPNLKVVGSGCFREAGPVRIITNQVPEIGKSSQMKGNTFEKGSVLVVPADVYDAYVKEHGSEKVNENLALEKGKAQTVVTVKVEGTSYDAVSLEDAVTQSGVAADDVTSIEFVSGTITAADLTYMKETSKYLADLKMNLNENLKLTDADGAESTVLPASAFKGTRLETVEIGGFTEIKADAFNGCARLESVSMPDMQVIGDEAFYFTDSYETIVLPASIKKLDNPNFGMARNGYKDLDVTMEGTTPPEVSGRIFVDARSGMIKVPEGTLPNYLPNLNYDKWFYMSGDVEWEGLPVEDSAYHFIEYKDTASTNKRYAYVKNGEAVTEARIPVFTNEGMEFAGWNTAEDGSGKAFDAQTVMSADWETNITVYARWAEPAPDVVIVKINGTEYNAKSVEDAVAKSGVDASDVESIEFVSGIITEADLTYMKETTTYLTDLKMNLNKNLKLTDAQGAETTELPAGAFKSTRLESVEIGGFTKVGSRAFESCTKLENVDMPNVKEIEKDAFYRTDAYETIILPESLETMTDPGFGGAANGKKTLDVTMEGSVPPTISGRVFGDAKGGTVTVPEGALPNYLTNLDFAKWFNTSGDSEWGGLPVIDPAYHLVHYKGVNSYDNKYAYVKDGETVTEDRIPVFENGDKVLVGWNTAEDGTGEALNAETQMSKEWTVSFTVYAQWAEEIPPVMDSVKAENGKVTIVLQDKPTEAPTLEDMKLEMNLNGTGNKDVEITDFVYDGDKTIMLTFDKVAQTDKTQKFTLTVTLDGKSMTSNEVTIEARDLVREFVARLYNHLLGRKPDPAGLDSWTEVLKSKKESGAKIAQGFIESPEFKKRNLSDEEYISVLYRTFLDREADKTGLAEWKKVLDDGLSRLYVFKGFAESDEFTEICNEYGIIRGNVILTAPMDQNENVTKFIARCYKFCLGRKGDEAGMNAWCNQILTGKNTAKQAAYGFVFSDEFEKKDLSDEEFAKTMYRVFMDREADKAGLESWVKVLENGQSREHVFNGFADSNEFKEICESYGIK